MNWVIYTQFSLPPRIRLRLKYRFPVSGAFIIVLCRRQGVTRGPAAENRLTTGRSGRVVGAERRGLRFLYVHSQQQTRTLSQDDYYGGRDR